MPKVCSPVEMFLYDQRTSATTSLMPNVVTEIDVKYVPYAIAQGLELITTESDPIPEPKMTLQSALEQIIMDGKPSDFNSLTKVPKVGAVSDLLGVKVSNEDIRAAWDAMDMPIAEDKEDDSE